MAAEQFTTNQDAGDARLGRQMLMQRIRTGDDTMPERLWLAGPGREWIVIEGRFGWIKADWVAWNAWTAMGHTIH
jgi:hypothetical protein